MHETYIVSGCAWPDSTGCKAKTLLAEPGIGRLEVVDPEAYVVQGRRIDARAFFGIDRAHQIDLDRAVAPAQCEDVLVYVFGLAAIMSGFGDAEQIAPQVLKFSGARLAQRDLL